MCQLCEFLVCVDFRGSICPPQPKRLHLVSHIPPLHEVIILLPAIPFYVYLKGHLFDNLLAITLFYTI